MNLATVTFLYPNGVRFNAAGAHAHCEKCGAFFKKGDTITLGADGPLPFKWIHKECYEQSKVQ